MAAKGLLGLRVSSYPIRHVNGIYVIKAASGQVVKAFGFNRLDSSQLSGLNPKVKIVIFAASLLHVQHRKGQGDTPSYVVDWWTDVHLT